MLRSLFIQNVALIESASLEFSEGLNVLSGETGAGKSVILDCIDFVLGAKADKSMVRYGASECLVRAEFSCESEGVKDVLAELDLEGEESIIVTRKLTAEGKGSLKVNGCPVTVQMLRRITSLLVDVHGQSEHFFLLKESNQLRMLDSIAGEPVAKCKAAVHEYLAARKNILASLAVLGGDEGERSRRIDVLRYQIDEIERAAIKEGEKEELLTLRERYRNAEKILQGVNEARECLLSDGGSVDVLNSAARALRAISRYGEQYAALAERIENAAADLSDAGDEADRLAGELDIDERDFERVEERLDEIKALERKYGGSVKAALAFLEDAKKECALLLDSGEQYEKLTKELGLTEDKLFKACLALTEARKGAANDFTRRVTAELKTLNISAARFEVEFDGYSREDVPRTTSEGLGGVRFLFSANAGEPLKELGKIISGGEMSRFMLAVKAQLSAIGEIGTYLFDEIDAGISGKTAKVVAEKFCNISKHVQIIAVSHLAQIAAFADREFLIEKSEKGGRALTCIHLLEGESRICEIARLVGGDTESEFALKHAEELVKNAQNYKNSL